MLRLAVLVGLVACSPPYHVVKLVNRTDRTVEQVFIYKAGAADHGRSRATLAPNAMADVKVAAGHVDVLAVSAKVRLDDKTNERRTATQTLELRGPLELIMHDSNKPAPAELRRPNTLGLTFEVEEAEPEQPPLTE